MAKYIDEHPIITKEIALDVMADVRKGLNSMNEIGIRETKISCSKYMIEVLDFVIEYLKGK